MAPLSLQPLTQLLFPDAARECDTSRASSQEAIANKSHYSLLWDKPVPKLGNQPIIH
jgi:hypothetical protein